MYSCREMMEIMKMSNRVNETIYQMDHRQVAARYSSGKFYANNMKIKGGLRPKKGNRK